MANELPEFDRLLEEALTKYGGVEPRFGFEQRVIHRVRAERTRRRTPVWSWAAMAGAALLLVALFIPSRNQSSAPIPPTPLARAPVAAPLIEQRTNAARIVPARLKQRRRSLPKQATFPTPSPLTTQERLLLKLIRENPGRAQILLTESKPSAIEPIEIPPLAVQPLQ